jgi:hypothetical protein
MSTLTQITDAELDAVTGGLAIASNVALTASSNTNNDVLTAFSVALQSNRSVTVVQQKAIAFNF